MNDIYKTIIKLDGDCFMAEERPPCQSCPFQGKCLHRMIALAESIPKEKRLGWALDELAEEYLLNDYDGE